MKRRWPHLSALHHLDQADREGAGRPAPTADGAVQVDRFEPVENLGLQLRTEMAGLEVRLLTAFGAFRDQTHADQRTTNRQIIIASAPTGPSEVAPGSSWAPWPPS